MTSQATGPSELFQVERTTPIFLPVTLNTGIDRVIGFSAGGVNDILTDSVTIGFDKEQTEKLYNQCAGEVQNFSKTVDLYGTEVTLQTRLDTILEKINSADLCESQKNELLQQAEGIFEKRKMQISNKKAKI